MNDQSTPCWLIPSATREQSELFLRDRPVGAFLVRQSTTGNNNKNAAGSSSSSSSVMFALSCRMTNGQVAHVRIEHCIDGSSDHWMVCDDSAEQ
jgi:hypothetical protein